MTKCTICKGSIGVLSKGTNFDEFESGRLSGNHAVANWNFETVLGYDLRQRKITSKEKQVIIRGMNERERRTVVNKQRKRQSPISRTNCCLEIQRSEDQTSPRRPNIDIEAFGDFPQPLQ
jgi:hypothetical protein